MSKLNLFGDEDEHEWGEHDDSEFGARNSDYATKYDSWRKKEELQKLKDRYGENPEVEEESDSESSSEEEWTNEHERQFLETLAALKSKDPRIFDQKNNFFVKNDSINQRQAEPLKEASTSRSPRAMFLKDYERKVILERQGKFSDESGDSSADEDDVLSKVVSGSYAAEEMKLKESFKRAIAEMDDDNKTENEGKNSLLRERVQTAEEQKQEDEDYVKWLKGREDTGLDADKLQTLVCLIEPLRSYWNNPKLDDGERFLRDFILERRYETADAAKNDLPTYDEIVADPDADKELEEDESELDRQAHFEHKYNFRFEEPDAEFVGFYFASLMELIDECSRVLQVKQYPRTIAASVRRTDERRKQQRESHKEKKTKEKQQRRDDIKRLKSLKLQEMQDKVDRLKRITGDETLKFDPEDLDKDFDPAEYDAKMQALFADSYYAQEKEDDEKPVFSDLSDSESDADLPNYDQWQTDDQQKPQCSKTIETSAVRNKSEKSRKKRKSRLADALTRDKPTFDPKEKSFQDYYDEYYKLDCEDFIGSMPCRFKYRQVPANDYGLSVEEIIMADDKELNAWASLKKMSQYRPEREEQYDRISYGRKAANADKKRKLLPTLYQPEKQPVAAESAEDVESEEPTSKKKRRRKSKKSTVATTDAHSEPTTQQRTASSATTTVVSDQNETVDEQQKTKTPTLSTQPESEPKSKKQRRRKSGRSLSQTSPGQNSENKNSTNISDERLKAYGINPKKYKNKLKYKNKS